MKQYWPCAECKRGDGIGFDPLFTYDAAGSLEVAMKQFSIWKYHYKYDMVKCWIDVYEDSKKLGTEEVWMDDIEDYREG